MKPINPTLDNIKTPQSALRQAQSTYKALNNGLELAVPVGQDSTGAYSKFEPGNSSGIMIRIGAFGSTNGQYQWPSAPNTALVINHGLLKQPLGFHVTDVDGNATVYRVSGATLDFNHISLAITDTSVNATVFIF